MELKNQTQLLRDKEIEPTEQVLENVMGENLFTIYQDLMKSFANEFGMEPQWRFYNDGKAWLCKVTYRKKTILWLSVWKDLIKTSFFFTAKARQGVLELEIAQNLKETFSETEPQGKLIPLVVNIEQKQQLADLIAIIKYKKKLK